MKKLIMFFIFNITYGGGILRAQEARRIIENANDVIDFQSSEMVTTLKICDDKGNCRIRQVANATNRFGETTKTILKFLSPADIKGTTLLIYDYENKDDDMWIYLPALRKSRRLISSEKGKSFMGSEFSNADMSKPTLEDFNYRLIGAENLNGIDCWKLESQCKNEEIESKSGFTRKISWIEKETYLTRKVEYFNGKEIPVKTMSMSDYRKQGNGKYFAFKMEMKNLLNNRWSEITIDKFQQGSQMAETNFAVSALGN
jgi:hypothetical protein